jgi:RNA polymerase sigma factor (sigma-70 family)
VADQLAVGDEVAADPASRQIVEDLHRRQGQLLWGFARRLGLDDAEAEDVVQEALLRLWHELRNGAPIERPDAWAFRTTYRLAMDRHRLRRRWRMFRERLAPPTHDSVNRRDEAIAAWAEVDRLPQRQRQVVYLRFRADLAFAIIGEVLGIEAATARSNATRALATLRERLGEEES